MTEDAGASLPAERRPTRPLYGWYLAVLFGLANCVSFMDRGFLGLVVDPVRKTFHLSDLQMGLLLGPAFILFYSLAALPIGGLADRHNRKGIIALGVMAWSFCTGCCGVVGSYAGLFTARMGIGLGEATLTPSAVSMLNDVQPPHRLNRAIGLFTGIGTVGGGLSLILGGALLGVMAGRSQIDVPLLGPRAPWQIVFLLMAVPGVILSAVIWATVREPLRVGRKTGQVHPTWGATLDYIRRYPRATIVMIVGFSMISGGGLVWMPTFFARQYGWSPARIGPMVGSMTLALSFPGVMLGAAAADLLRKRGRRDANLLAPLACLCVMLPCAALLPNTGSPYGALVLYGVSLLFTMMCFGCSTPAAAMAAPPRMRSRLTAIYLLGGNLVGQGIGPVAVPLLTEHVFGGGREALRYALTITPVVTFGIAMALLLTARRPFVERVSALSTAD